MILDSGNRRTFESGAVRDMPEGKGRCDLLPLPVLSRLFYMDYIIQDLSEFQQTNDVEHLLEALSSFARFAYEDSRETMVLEVSKHFEEGAKKYGEDNWQKGIPVNCYLDSALRHYLKWRRGDKDEPHDRAFVWNIMCCIWEVTYHHDPN